MYRIKLSLYMKRNTPYIFRNCFLAVINHNKDLDKELNNHIEHIRYSLKNSELEADINPHNAFLLLTNYIKDNITNYREIKKVLKYDFNNIISPKTTFKVYLGEIIENKFYLDALL